MLGDRELHNVNSYGESDGAAKRRLFLSLEHPNPDEKDVTK